MGCCGGGLFSRNQKRQMGSGSSPMQPSLPIDALKTRLAQGEISVEEYQKLLRVLQEDTVPRY